MPELDALLTNPETDSRVKADVLERVLGDADELSRNFAAPASSRRAAAGEIREVVAEFETLVTDAGAACSTSS